MLNAASNRGGECCVSGAVEPAQGESDTNAFHRIIGGDGLAKRRTETKFGV
jgi:hypothetical protein